MASPSVRRPYQWQLRTHRGQAVRHSMSGFVKVSLTPVARSCPRAATAGVGEAPRHEIAGGERRGGSRLWGISLDADSSDRGFGGRKWLGGAVGWYAGLFGRPERGSKRLPDVCFGAWVKGDKT